MFILNCFFISVACITIGWVVDLLPSLFLTQSRVTSVMASVFGILPHNYKETNSCWLRGDFSKLKSVCVHGPPAMQLTFLRITKGNLTSQNNMLCTNKAGLRFPCMNPARGWESSGPFGAEFKEASQSVANGILQMPCLVEPPEGRSLHSPCVALQKACIERSANPHHA